MRPKHIPNIVKHCALEIFHTGRISYSSRKDKFIQSLTIARSRLQEYGFILVSDGDLAGEISLTPKGRVGEMKHSMEGVAKSVMFDRLYRQFDIDGSDARKKEERRLKDKERRQAEAKKRGAVGPSDDPNEP